MVYFAHYRNQQKIINEKELALKAIEKKISGEEIWKSNLKEKEMLDSEDILKKLQEKNLVWLNQVKEYLLILTNNIRTLYY